VNGKARRIAAEYSGLIYAKDTNLSVIAHARIGGIVIPAALFKKTRQV
jgi:hypothetical protein